MAKQIKARRVGRTGKAQFSSRELWLAGLGAVSLGRKQARSTFEAMNTGALQFERRVRADLTEVIEAASSRGDLLRVQAEGVLHDVRGFVVPARYRAEGLVADAIARADRLARPLLAKLGVSVKAPARRAPAKRKAATAKRPVKAKPAAKAPVRRARKAA